MSPKPHFAWLRRPLAVWVAVLIAVFGALAPTLSQALVLAQGAMPDGVEVCTGTGMRWVATNAPTDSQSGQESAVNLERCPFCLLSTDHLGPPDVASVHLFMEESGLARPDKPLLFLKTFIRFSALPRGPPRFVL